MCIYMPAFNVHRPYYRVLLVQGKFRGVKWLIGWRRPILKKIQKLLEIFERERHHEVLLTLKNLCDLSRNLAPYSIPVIPLPLPTEIVEGEHYVTTDLLNLLPGNSSPAREPEAQGGWSGIGDPYSARATFLY